MKPSPAELEAAIGRTRSELGRTLDALERKLAARHLVQEGLTMVTESFTGTEDGRSRVAEAIRANPLPLALIGAGVAWLVAENTGLLDRVAQDERIQTAVRQISDVAASIGDGAAALGAQTVAGDGWVHRAAGAVRNTGSVVIERAGGYAGDRATQVAAQAAQVWQRNALLLGMIGLVVGAVAAAVVPLTRIEAR